MPGTPKQVIKSKLFALYAEQLHAFKVLWVTQRSLRHAKKNKTLCETLLKKMANLFLHR
jgi:hypothetical protein